jgi:hypothetical protein
LPAPIPALFVLAAKFGLVAAINDAGYEATISILKKIQKIDRTGLSDKLLEFLSSDHDIVQGVQLKNKSDKDAVITILTANPLAVNILTSEEASKKLHSKDGELSAYDILMHGKPRDLLSSTNDILAYTKSIEPLSKDAPMNTVFGRLYEMMRKKITTSKTPKI